MTQRNIFISAATPRSDEQRQFKRAIAASIRNLGFAPRTVGNEADDTDHPFVRPLEHVAKVLAECDGAVVIAYEKHFAREIIDNRVSANPAVKNEVKLASAWNHAEAAIAYTQGIPLLLIAERGVRQDGMLEPGVIGYVDETELSAAYVSSGVFQGRLDNWAKAVRDRSDRPRDLAVDDLEKITFGQLLSSLKKIELKTMATLVGGAFLVVSTAFSIGTYVGSLPP